MSNVSLQPATNTIGRVLAAEDDRSSMMVLVTILESLNYEVLKAENGREALDIVAREAETLDIILLDRMMPEMDGLQAIAALKDDPKARHIPIIMLTGSDKPEEVKQGIDAGVFYYLIKPYEHDVFESVLTSALREARRHLNLKSELKKHQTSFGFIDKAAFSIHKLDEAEDLACFIANCFSNPHTALPGLAGMLVNAIEHGNLGIGYEMKTTLLKEGRWRAEIEERQNHPDFEHKSVKVDLIINDQETRVTITDEGKGFNWQNYLEIDPARALDSHGRGIAQANKISFDDVQYNEKGNVVTIISSKDSGIKW